jgi:DNA-binding NtrC family response regulator
MKGVTRVLVVEDDPTFLAITVSVLRKAGYSAVPASSAEQALEIFGTTPVDVVLSDAVMPGLQGPELLEIIRRTEPGTALLLMSASQQVPATRVTFLRKPFRAADLIEAIERTLAHARKVNGIPAHAELAAAVKTSSAHSSD